MKTNRYDKIDFLIAMAAANCLKKESERFEALDTRDVEFDEDYYRKKARMIKRNKRRPVMKKIKLFAVRAAVILLSLILLAALVIGCVPPVREAVFKALVEWHDNYFKVSFQPDNGNEPISDSQSDGNSETANSNAENLGNSSVESPTPPTQIETVHKPTNLPQGVYEDIAISNDNCVIIDYYLNDGLVGSYSQKLMDTQGGYDDMNATVTEIMVNGYKGVFIEYKNDSPDFIEWSDGEYRYQIMSDVYGIDELLAIAESVK